MSTGSNITQNQFQYTYEKDSVTVFGSFEVDGYGAVSHYQGGDVALIEQTATGTYEVTLTTGWDYFFALDTTIVKTTASAVATVQLANDPATLQADTKLGGPFVLLCLNYAGAAANPETTASIRFKLVMRRSRVGPFDAGVTV